MATIPTADHHALDRHTDIGPDNSGLDRIFRTADDTLFKIDSEGVICERVPDASVGIRELHKAHEDHREEYMYVGRDTTGADHIFRTIDDTLFRIDPETGVIERFLVESIDRYVQAVRDKGKWEHRRWIAADENWAENLVDDLTAALNASPEQEQPS